MAATEPVSDAVAPLLNRLSDLLFVLARTLNRAAGRPDVLWQKDRGPIRADPVDPRPGPWPFACPTAVPRCDIARNRRVARCPGTHRGSHES